MIEVPLQLAELLGALPWRAEIGSNHVKIFLDGRMILVLPKRLRRNDDIGDNTRTNVRRAIKQFQERKRSIR